MASFIAHPSVRIKGTEHNYNPVLCQDDQCAASVKGRHTHCPFCSISEAYQDPFILRAHYRVKHVDKGLDFAGLKILRCCNHCEIVGTIKGEKKFKGAHWHCYRCRNGFNRRDEAVKHYKTHFRNPHTTFQIQIAQDVNSRQYYERSAEANHKAYGGLSVSTGANVDVMSIGALLAQNVLASRSPAAASDKGTESLLGSPAKDSSFNSGMALGAEETVGLSTSSSSIPAHQTLVLMDPDGDGSSIIFEDGPNSVSRQSGESLDQNLLEKQLIELHQQNQQLLEEKKEMECRLRAEILQLKEHIASIIQANIRMAEELKRYQASDDLEKKVSKMVEQMEWQHRELLQMHVAALRKEFVQRNSRPMNGKSSPPASAALESKEHAMTSSAHSLLANAALSSPNSTLSSGLAAPQDTLAPTQLDISAGDVLSFIDPPESLPNSGDSQLDRLETVEVHLDTEHPISSLEAGSPPAHVHLLPVSEMNEPVGLLPSARGEKRLAQHTLARESKAKVQRTV
ncbi:uncharacterized protein LOC102388405 isoform X1 [Alligator sinensis]|uniref:Uncharacterized protein LOC102388405 isoform X1 n=1 Tax=Alligator sinensis TaxID=38654 RepID=A0A1U7RF59_ALLSI|nr:uncharacterized protein LOC102388405 isoform X1 [Alligator sinensis]